MRVPELPDDAGLVWPAATPNETVQDRVYRHMSFLLVCGFFRPGETVSLRQLSAALGVSEMPVRNALNRLTAESVLDLLPNRHVCIPALTRPQFDELTRLRTLLETEITEAAFEKVTRDDITRLRDINTTLVEAINQRKIQRCVEFNQRFHLGFYALGRRPLTFSIITKLWLRAGAFMNLTLRSDHVTWRAHRHQALLDGLAERNLRVCIDAIREDIADTYAEIGKQPGSLLAIAAE
jgi:DNA-binding GntR family transcriptional regulator